MADALQNIAKIREGEHSTIQSVLETEHELETVLLGVGIPVRPVPITSIVGFVFYFPCGNAESDSLVWLGSDLKPT